MTYVQDIMPVSNDKVRPLWSVLIPTYNCAEYLKETLASVLVQDPGSSYMEIIVIDDCSTKDDPESVVNDLGKGRVQFIRQEKNVGKVLNYETGLQVSRGILIHQLHGDDRVRPGFYKEMERIFNTYQDAKAAFCRTIYIDAQSRWTQMTGMLQNTEGVVPDMAERLYTVQHIQTPSMVVKREVYEQIGAFDRRLNCMEDWEMWTRIANYFPIAISNKVLAEYRAHGQNATQLTYEDGSALHMHQLVCTIVDEYIQPNIKQEYYKLRNKEQAAFWLLSYNTVKTKLNTNEKLKFMRKVLYTSFSLKNLIKLLR